MSENHVCTPSDLVTCPKPIEAPDGEQVAFSARCIVCGKAYEVIYTRVPGFYDPDKKETVFAR